jgi:hypothetical protein
MSIRSVLKKVAKEALTEFVSGVIGNVADAVGERIGKRIHPEWTRTQEPEVDDEEVHAGADRG